MMHATAAARAYCKKDSEVVLLVNPAASQVREISIVDYKPKDLLYEKVFPQAHQCTCVHFWSNLWLRLEGGGNHLAALSQR
jgi:hypothetical protein